jgi:hypothetical protein
MTQDEFLAREAIRKTLADYTIAGDDRDPTLFDPLWAEDALFEFAGFPPVPGFRCQGAAEIRARSAAWTPLPIEAPGLVSATFVRHNLTTCRIELTGPGTARAKTYFMVVTDIGLDHAGNYIDELVRRGDRWLFAHRRVELVWRAPEGIFPPRPA